MATPAGFLVLADLGEGESGVRSGSEIWRTVDGSKWELAGVFPAMERVEVLDGTVVAVGPGIRVLDTGQELLPPDATAGLDLVFSEFGVFGLSTPEQQRAGTIDALYSADGTSWIRWGLSIDAPVSQAEIVGVGDGFVILSDVFGSGGWRIALP